MKKGKGVAMSTDQGRDETVILKKGFVKVKHFSDLDGINLKGDHAHNEGPGESINDS